MLRALRFIGTTAFVAALAACSDEQPAQPPTPQTQAPAAGSEPQLAPTPTPPPLKAEGGAVAGGQGQPAQGEQVYNQTCAACHTAGVAGAPKLGDKAAWAPRIAQGEQVMFNHAKNGFQGKTGFMPPKGGNAALTDAQLKAAIDYMISKVK